MKLKNSFLSRPRAGRTRSALAALLAALTLTAGLPAAGPALAQTTPAKTPAEAPASASPTAKKPLSFPALPASQGRAFVIYRSQNGEVGCRLATPEERRQILERDPGVKTSPLRRAERPSLDASDGASAAAAETGGANVNAAGLNIVFRTTTQLQNHADSAQVIAAFERAAAQWEALVASNITVVIDIDYGTTDFGDPFGPNVLGSTSNGVFFIPPYSDVRARLIGRASSAEESGLYSSLPTGTLPTDRGAATTMAIESPVARALGAIPAHADPDTTDPDSEDFLGNAPSISFNANFGFDFNPDNGITAGRTDFLAVAVHEIGHALGFTSSVGVSELEPTFGVWPSVWDLFRFRQGAAAGQFTTAQRILTPGGSPAHVHFDGGPELQLSTANPDRENGDGRQASHWKDDALTGNFIGIMDPTIPSGVSEDMTANDIRALNFFGYVVGSTGPAPANDNFANPVVLTTAAGTTSTNTTGATKEAGEPNHANNTGGASVWYNFTANSSGTATIDTRGSSFDTTLAVYTGNSVGGLSLACGAPCQNDDIGGTPHDTDSRVTFQATAGTTYRIAVDGFDGDFGSLVLNWTLPGVVTPTPVPTPSQTPTPAPTPVPTPVPSVFEFSGAVYSAQEHDRSAGILINRSGDTSAQQTITLNLSGNTSGVTGPLAGQVTFAPGETAKAAAITIQDDLTPEGTQPVTLTLAPLSPNTQIGPLGTATLNINDDDTFPANSVQFDGAALRVVAESGARLGQNLGTKVDLTVTRSGTLTQDAFVDYRTFDSTALSTKDYTFAGGTLHFGVGEATKTITVLITEDFHDEPNETFNVQLLNPLRTTVSLANPIVTVQINDDDAAGVTTNPSDATANFVDQHYNDFLNRHADQGGLDFWSQGVNGCGANAQCRQVKRIDTSAAFYLAIEFQETGYLVYRMYKAAYGNIPGKPVPVRFDEFMIDTQEIGRGVQVGIGDWFQQLENNKAAFQLAFVQRGRFKTALPDGAAGLSPAHYVDRLNANIGGLLTPARRQQLVDQLAANNTAQGRALVLRQVADDAAFRDAETRRAFVLMQYFGYLRRNPDDVGFDGQPDPNFLGYGFWLGKLNEFGGDFRRAEMVKAFIESIEYRQRFGQ